MLHREQAGGGAGRGVDLQVDVLDMVADGLRSDDEVLGDLLVGQAAREVPQDLDLARGQAGWTRATAEDAMTGGAQDRFDRLAVEASGLDLGAQFGGCLFS